MSGFVGRYEHSLDVKGRVILPSKFRPAFDRGGYLSTNHEGCLALWTLEEFEHQMANKLEAAAINAEERNRARVWAASSHEVEIDRNGRMAIPGHLRTFAELGGEVLVMGAIDRIELWNPSVWETQVAPAANYFRGGATG